MSITIIYGGTSLIRATCPSCQSEALVIENRFLCCGIVFDIKSDPIVATKSETTLKLSRKLPPIEFREEVLRQQYFKCFYCDQYFGEYEYYKGKKFQIRICWDHFVPYSFLGTNPKYNFVAACQVCNSIKHSKLFNTVEEAIQYVKSRRSEKGYKLERTTKKLSNMQQEIFSSSSQTDSLFTKLPTKELEGSPSTQLIGTRSNCNKCGACFIIREQEMEYCSPNCRNKIIIKSKPIELTNQQIDNYRLLITKLELRLCYKIKTILPLLKPKIKIPRKLALIPPTPPIPNWDNLTKKEKIDAVLNVFGYKF